MLTDASRSSQDNPLQLPLNKCAVVGNGGILRGSKCGKDIDRADFIMRWETTSPHVCNTGAADAPGWREPVSEMENWFMERGQEGNRVTWVQRRGVEKGPACLGCGQVLCINNAWKVSISCYVCVLSHLDAIFRRFQWSIWRTWEPKPIWLQPTPASSRTGKRVVLAWAG